MVDYLNSELCNTLGNLLSRCTSKSINQSQEFPLPPQSGVEETAIGEWLPLLESLRQLPGKLYSHWLAGKPHWFHIHILFW